MIFRHKSGLTLSRSRIQATFAMANSMFVGTEVLAVGLLWAAPFDGLWSGIAVAMCALLLLDARMTMRRVHGVLFRGRTLPLPLGWSPASAEEEGAEGAEGTFDEARGREVMSWNLRAVQTAVDYGREDDEIRALVVFGITQGGKATFTAHFQGDEPGLCPAEVADLLQDVLNRGVIDRWRALCPDHDDAAAEPHSEAVPHPAAEP